MDYLEGPMPPVEDSDEREIGEDEVVEAMVEARGATLVKCPVCQSATVAQQAVYIPSSGLVLMWEETERMEVRPASEFPYLAEIEHEGDSMSVAVFRCWDGKHVWGRKFAFISGEIDWAGVVQEDVVLHD